MADIELTLRLHHETELAIRVSDDGEDKNAVWLPLSKIEVERKPKNIVVVTVPEWLAMDKGLI